VQIRRRNPTGILHATWNPLGTLRARRVTPRICPPTVKN
jgi:hypothetical protein